ncbi:uncharacterized protein MYCGRDRAFT_93486 [Zymoseptoria tritici IPO323]|uniref:Uncharacterized protein n=1 Tax=Zymoseptoria tritici (strain CBS 115943 / IPO323) TaxID=336722 RepID=F9XC67_ZYMTI|nr:uncharacterized protein MYCGRDRAFT_93486 [Zymoseptoria tritici IPO323]EGP87448.1 hypothetical protein MYCGRDRAFT_93486 [Zymoseptoria tritici IPO323]
MEMESISEEEFHARLAYLHGQKSLEEAAAESARRTLKLNDEIEQLRRQQKPEDIQYNETPANAPARNGFAPAHTAVATGSMRLQQLRLLDSDVPDQQAIQQIDEHQECARSTKTKIPSSVCSSYVVDDQEFHTITRAPNGNDFVELRCSVCGANSRKAANVLRFFRGVPAFRQHVRASHQDLVAKEDTRTDRQIVERDTYRTLSAAEKHSVLNGDHAAFKIEKILAGDADAEARMRSARAPHERRSYADNAAHNGKNMQASHVAVPDGSDMYSVASSGLQTSEMTSYDAAKRRKRTDYDEDDDEPNPRKTLKKQE